MEFKRESYIKKLIACRHSRSVKVITGLRRCGKSYLLFTLYKNYLLSDGVKPDHILEMSFEGFDNVRYRDPDVFYPYVMEFVKDDGEYYILLDEVQLLGQFESVLNSLLRVPNLDIYVTGSNARFLSEDIITEFRGRGTEIRLSPLSFSEFMECFHGSEEKAWGEYSLFGGLPDVVLKTDSQEKIVYLNGLMSETYVMDILERNNLRNRQEMEAILDFLASSVGSSVNPMRIALTFRKASNSNMSPKTVKKYLGWLVDAFMIDCAMRYNVKIRKYIGTPMKYYFTDVGLRNARIDFRQGKEETRTMENVIYNELRNRGYHVDVGVVPFFERNNGVETRNMGEIDFVCKDASKQIYVQSVLSMPDDQKERQEIRPLLKTEDAFRKIIVTKDTYVPWYTKEGVLVIGLYDFLLDSDSLNKV